MQFDAVDNAAAEMRDHETATTALGRADKFE